MKKLINIGRSSSAQLSDERVIAGHAVVKLLKKLASPTGNTFVRSVPKRHEQKISSSIMSSQSSTPPKASKGGTFTPDAYFHGSQDGKCSAFSATSKKPEEKMSEGKKFDQEKVRLDLLPSEAIYSVGRVLTHGCKKYGARNWENGFAWTRAIGAILRHSFSYLRGETLDPETGESHMAHVACEALFLLHFEKTHPELDDRPK